MTDRVRYLTVMLDDDYRDDDARTLAEAISMLKGVEKVTLGDPVSVSDYINRQTVGIKMYETVVEAARRAAFDE